MHQDIIEMACIMAECPKCGFECGACAGCGKIMEATKLFEAGFRKTKEEPKIVWHKIADEDYPEKDDDYLCYCHYHGTDRNGEIMDGVCQEVVNYTKEYGFFTLVPHKVVAWCEMPKYEE